MTKVQERVERLKQFYSGPMSEHEVEIVRDMQAFLEFCLENGLSSQVAFGTLAHDVGGLLRQETGFLPKVAGYTRILNDLRAEMNDPPAPEHSETNEKWD